jgi:phage-related protein
VVIVVPACRRELDGLPLEVRGDLADALARLDAGLVLAMPCRVRCRVSAEESHELRLRDRSGHYRVIYAIIRRGMVHVLHAFKKTTQTTPQRHMDIARRRLKEATQ